MLDSTKGLVRKIVPESAVRTLWHAPRAYLFAASKGFPGHRLTVIAIAGTKGKTTTAYLTSELLRAAGHRVALLSTAAIRIADDEKLNPYKMTSPSPQVVQRFFKDAIAANCTYAVVEVSSHAITQFRFAGVPFSYAIITNLASDHLEYHATTEEYQVVHRKLITSKLKALVVNGDDPNCAVVRGIARRERVYQAGDEIAERLAELKLTMPGEYNFRNAHAAATLADELQVPWSVVSKALQGDITVPGRFERVEAENGANVIVDYAHSPESLEAFFAAAAPLKGKGRLITVYGACGERDPQVRPAMGASVDRWSDVVIVTNDDPYGEDPELIAEQVISGIANKHWDDTLFKILDRRQAISHALKLAGKHDLVVVLGKGSEQYQVIGSVRRQWDDREVVREEAARLARA
jgi:UDP-N-acetylmuramyl tripeptide synthase